MSELKCPFCNRNLHKGEDGMYSHLDYMTECKGRLFDGSKQLWQELIRTRKALEQSEICCTEWEKQALDYKAENIALSGDLERTRKALEIAVDALNKIINAQGQCWGATDTEIKFDCKHYASEALDEITALEQKD